MWLVQGNGIGRGQHQGVVDVGIAGILVPMEVQCVNIARQRQAELEGVPLKEAVTSVVDFAVQAYFRKKERKKERKKRSDWQ